MDAGLGDGHQWWRLMEGRYLYNLIITVSASWPLLAWYHAKGKVYFLVQRQKENEARKFKQAEEGQTTIVGSVSRQSVLRKG